MPCADDTARCYEAGMGDFIAEPIKPDVIFEVVVNWREKEGGEINRRNMPTRLKTEQTTVSLWLLGGVSRRCYPEGQCQQRVGSTRSPYQEADVRRD